MFYLGLTVISVIFSVYMYIQYKHTASPWLVYIAIFYGIMSQLVWVFSIRNLNNKDIFINGFVWDLVLTILLLVIPFYYADNMNFSKIQIIGITLMLIGSFLLKIE
jgi:hypothetical protein